MDFKRKLWIGLAGLTVLSGVVIAVMVVLGDDYWDAISTCFVVLVGCLFIITSLYSAHKWLTWSASSLAIVSVAMQNISIWSSDYQTNWAGEWVALFWTIAIITFIMSLFSMSYRFVQKERLGSIAYWSGIGLAMFGAVLFVIEYIRGVNAHDYYGDSMSTKLYSAAFILATFIGLVVAVYAVIARRQELKKQSQTIQSVDALLQDGAFVAHLPANDVSGNNTLRDNPYITPELAAAFLVFTKMQADGTLEAFAHGNKGVEAVTSNSLDTEDSATDTIN